MLFMIVLDLDIQIHRIAACLINSQRMRLRYLGSGLLLWLGDWVIVMVADEPWITVSRVRAKIRVLWGLRNLGAERVGREVG